MIDWDDVRYLLAIARSGSVRAASQLLRVNHATVLRRIGQLEENLGTRLFDKLPGGYRLTEAGQEVLAFAEQMEAASNRLEAHVYGRDQSAKGPLRVTLTPMLATHLLMPDLATFSNLYPEIELVVISRDEPVNLTNREADVAIRVIHDRAALQLNLHALKGPELHGGVYLSRELLAAWQSRKVSGTRWILKEYDGMPDWARAGDIPIDGIAFRTTEAGAHIAAVRQGLGVTALPCFVGDSDSFLARVPGSDLHRYGTLWLLTHGGTRKTKRVRLFTRFMAERLTAHAPLLSGLRPGKD